MKGYCTCGSGTWEPRSPAGSWHVGVGMGSDRAGRRHRPSHGLVSSSGVGGKFWAWVRGKGGPLGCRGAGGRRASLAEPRPLPDGPPQTLPSRRRVFPSLSELSREHGDVETIVKTPLSHDAPWEALSPASGPAGGRKESRREQGTPGAYRSPAPPRCAWGRRGRGPLQTAGRVFSPRHWGLVAVENEVTESETTVY